MRVWLDAEHPGDVERFARAVEQMLGPVTDEFRYMIPRTELVLPEEPVARLRFIKDWALTGQGGQVIAWHPVPRDLGTRAETVRYFEAAWQRHVSPGEALFLKRSDVPLEQLRSARSRRPWIESRAKRIWH